MVDESRVQDVAVDCLTWEGRREAVTPPLHQAHPSLQGSAR